MSQSCAPVQVNSTSLQQLQADNAQLRQYLNAQKVVIASLERRAGRSLESLGIHLTHLTDAAPAPAHWQQHLSRVQDELDSLCDLVSDTLLLQKLEAGRVEARLEPLDVHHLITIVTRHLRTPNHGNSTRLICQSEPSLPRAIADQDLTEAVLTDLVARGLKYSDSDTPVALEAEQVGEQLRLHVTAQRFAPPGNRDFATEIVLCCRRIEVQQGQISCQQRTDGLQTVTISFALVADS
jgi:signal transduction histidine kinase